MRWGKQYHSTIIAKDNGELYTSFKTLLKENRVKPCINIKNAEQVNELLNTIEERWDSPRIHIIRASQSSLNERVLIEMVREKGWIISVHNSTYRIYDIDTIFSQPPTHHHVILIKGFWRASKTLDDKYIGVCLESTKDYTAIAQGLGGRLLGYKRQSGHLAPLVYCNVKAVKEYVMWLDNDADYLKCKRYTSAALKVKNGDILKKFTSVVDPEEIANLEAVELEKPIKTDKKLKGVSQQKPKKVGNIVWENGCGYTLATSVKTYKKDEFKK
jgi:hypothetical protein